MLTTNRRTLETLYNILYRHEYGSQELTVTMAKAYLGAVHLGFSSDWHERHFWAAVTLVAVSATKFEYLFTNHFDWPTHNLWNSSNEVFTGLETAIDNLKKQITP